MYCYFCRDKKIETWTGYFCPTCEKIQSISKCYGFDRTLNVLEKCCIRNSAQLENKIASKALKESNDIFEKEEEMKKKIFNNLKKA